MPKRALIKGAAIAMVALLLFERAEAQAPKVQTVQDIVRRAQDLALHHRRKEALKLLQDSHSAGGATKAQDREALRESLTDLASRFITDKGQRSFELGQSLLPNQAGQALHHFEEAATQEDGNLQVSLGIIRAHLAAEDCRTAESALQGGLGPLYAISTPLQEIALEVAWCREDQAAVEALLKPVAHDQRLSPATQKVAQAWVKWMGSENIKAAALLREALALESQNPAALYWNWKISKDLEQDSEEGAISAAQAYLGRCRGKEKDIRRRQAPLIEMCLRVMEVDAYLKARPTEAGNGA